MNGGGIPLDSAAFRRPGVLGQNQYMPMSGQYQMQQWSNPMWRPNPVAMPMQPLLGSSLTPGALALLQQSQPAQNQVTQDPFAPANMGFIGNSDPYAS